MKSDEYTVADERPGLPVVNSDPLSHQKWSMARLFVARM
jgi:hypothetical protein